jgi:hypothetical protein
MKYLKIPCFCLLLTVMLGGMAVCALAQDETSTEISGFYQSYHNFDYRTGYGEGVDIQKAEMNGGGFGIAQNLSSWFAIWTQFSFLGTTENSYLSVRIINNLQGLRYQTPQYGPFRFYGKGGIGFTNYSINLVGQSGGETKISFGYGGGAQVWMTDYIGVFVDGSHVIMGVPNISDLEGREKWDSGLTLTTGLAVRF